MRPEQLILGLLIAGAAAPASARGNDVSGDAVIGKVETVFICESKGLYFEKKLLRNTRGKELWAEIRFANSFPDDPDRELYKLPENTTIERGDLVATRNADPMPSVMKLLPEVSRVTQLIAKHDTLMAMSFGLSNSRPMKGLTVQAAMCSNPPAFIAYAD